jgi:hypothetical protein
MQAFKASFLTLSLVRFVNVLCYALAKGFIIFNNALRCAEAAGFIRVNQTLHQIWYFFLDAL